MYRGFCIVLSSDRYFYWRGRGSIFCNYGLEVALLDLCNGMVVGRGSKFLVSSKHRFEGERL